MPVSVLEYAYMSEDVYCTDDLYINNLLTGDNNSAVVLHNYGWQRILQQEIIEQENSAIINSLASFKEGFYAAIYKNYYHNDAVIAYRGTVVTAPGSVLADMDMIKNSTYSIQDEEAMQYYVSACEYLHKSKFNVTGHSLGGYLASIVALQFNVTAVVFNAPGVINQTGLPAIPGFSFSHLFSLPATPMVHEFNISTDIVHKIDNYVGMRFSYMDQNHKKSYRTLYYNDQYNMSGDPLPRWIQNGYHQSEYGLIVKNYDIANFRGPGVAASLGCLDYYYQEHKIDSVVDKLKNYPQLAGMRY